MSFRAIVEIVIHFESFRNIDLCKQGYYCLEVQISYTVGESVYQASPYAFYAKEVPRSHHGDSGDIDEFAFRCKTFHIKYCDEEFEINEIAVFRIEIDTVNVQPPELTIFCNLLYSDSNPKLNHLPSNFNVDSTCLIQIPNCLEGINQFLPITFDETHFCVMNSTIHAIPVDFRFRPTPIKTNLEENSIGFANSNEINVNNVLTNLFFSDMNSIDKSLINLIQARFVKSLLKVYEKNLQLIKPYSEYNESLALHAEKIEETEPEVITQIIVLQIQAVAEKLNLVLFEFVQILRKNSKIMCQNLMLEYNELVKDRWGESIFQNFEQVDDFCELVDEKMSKNHKKIAKKIRNSQYYQNMEKLPVFLSSYYPLPEHHPILFLDVASKECENKLLWDPRWINYMSASNKSLHVVVFVHGFQGSAFDLRLIRNQLSMCRCSILLMCSSVNEDHTDKDIAGMGKRLAEEVRSFIYEWCPSNKFDKISFIGHSLGGLIIRAALPALEEYRQKFQFYMTFSTPHLGYMYNSSALVDAGMWLIKKFKKSQCMKELSMTDSENHEDTYLFRLSTQKGLEWFKHLAFVSSLQDNYAPYESARIQVGKSATSSNNGRVYIKMTKNLLGAVNARRIHRIDAYFNMKKKGIDNVIGRAAHIQMLDNRVLINMILHCCASFFEE